MRNNCIGCFANCSSMCTALVIRIDSKCPFYKTAEQQQAERRCNAQRLKDLGRDDLINKYRSEARYG